MSRINRRFAALQQEGRAGLVTFLTAGDPDPDTSARLFAGLASAGADLIEIGMPFSDPMADGPVIQDAGQRALQQGMTLRRTLEMVRQLRRADDETPTVLMGYYNPIYRYGTGVFPRDAVAAGVDGVIVVDLPPEEDLELTRPARAAGLDVVRLATPTRPHAFSSAWMNERRPAPAKNRRARQGLHLLCRDRRHHRDPLGGRRKRRRCRRPGAPVHPIAGGGRLRHPHTGTSRGSSPRRRRRGGRLLPRATARPKPEPRQHRQARARRRSARRCARIECRDTRRPAVTIELCKMASFPA